MHFWNLSIIIWTSDGDYRTGQSGILNIEYIKIKPLIKVLRSVGLLVKG